MPTRTTYPARKPGFMDRLRRRPAKQPAEVSTKHSTNPITGTHTTTHTTKTHPHGIGHHGHAGHGPMGTTHHKAPVQHHKRKPTMGDKLSGGLLKMEGSLTHKPGKKAAGTRRMHGTDGRGAHRAY